VSSGLATASSIHNRANYSVTMPRYEYRCRACGETFEVSRAMREANEPARCPSGHDDSVKLLSTVALTGRGSAGSTRSAPMPAVGGGGCCGGSCGC
jgi:putative FmdB family regulatory protein